MVSTQADPCCIDGLPVNVETCDHCPRFFDATAPGSPGSFPHTHWPAPTLDQDHLGPI